MRGKTALTAIMGRYAAILTAALVLFVFEPVLAGERGIPWGLSAVSLLLLVGSLRAVWEDRAFFRVVVVLGAGYWVCEALEPLAPDALPIATDVFGLAFLGATIGGILSDIFRRTEITADTVFGASAVYLLIGLWFARGFMLIAHVEPGAFAVSDALDVELQQDDFRSSGLLYYFSLITLTTVGYGDIAPVSPVARNLAAVEAVIAQLFIAAVIARLVGLYTTAANAPES